MVCRAACNLSVEAIVTVRRKKGMKVLSLMDRNSAWLPNLDTARLMKPWGIERLTQILGVPALDAKLGAEASVDQRVALESLSRV